MNVLKRGHLGFILESDKIILAYAVSLKMELDSHVEP